MRWKFHLGTTRDDPKNGHLRTGNPDLNWTAYVGTIFDMNKDLRLALEEGRVTSATTSSDH